MPLILVGRAAATPAAHSRASPARTTSPFCLNSRPMSVTPCGTRRGGLRWAGGRRGPGPSRLRLPHFDEAGSQRQRRVARRSWRRPAPRPGARARAADRPARISWPAPAKNTQSEPEQGIATYCSQELATIFEQVDFLLCALAPGRGAGRLQLHGPPVVDAETGFVEVREVRSHWAPDPANPLPTFNPPLGVTASCLSAGC